MTKRFVSWNAVSSLPQAKKISIADQMATARQHIDRHGGVLVAELVVPGKSRSIILWEDACLRIEAYAQLRDLIQAKAFDVLIYLDRSRLGRKASLIMAVVELCREAGILCYEIESPPANLELSTSHDEMLIGAIKSVGAQQEVIKIQERHRKGMIGRVLNGHFPGNLPYGYRHHFDEDGTRHVLIDENKAVVVRLMLVDLYLKRGWGGTAIAAELNRRGYLSPDGVPWQRALVIAIINKVWRYAGWSEINRKSKTRPFTRAKGNWQPIITEAEAEQIEAERKRRLTARRTIGDTYRFSMCVYCAVCGRRMAMNTGITNHNTGHVRRMMRCYGGDHDKRTITERAIYKAVRAYIERIVADPAYRQSLFDQNRPDAATWQAQIGEVDAQIERTKAGRLRADDAYVGGAMDAERYRRQVERLTEQIETLEAERERLQDEAEQAADAQKRQERLNEVLVDGLAMLDHVDVQAANAWLRRLFRIWVRDHRVERIELL